MMSEWMLERYVLCITYSTQGKQKIKGLLLKFTAGISGVDDLVTLPVR